MAACQEVLGAAYQQHPERFVRGVPPTAELPEAVWINPPAEGSASEELLTKFDEQLSQFY